ncbi:hypothetical protein N180_03075 [Pedobacter antarcticus 4BY]|uniref:HTH luxR-type domain-containing protein n=2 Tax=Pedobacter antarcticus TaxID=34086 RepID=A0A081PKM1_9SPHI|nr:hypothetical protein N180_03075 [Pedobacter antarcticus 4BY]SFE56175.1 regulatory protein, luxR family [Pedobacter antarcticus]
MLQHRNQLTSNAGFIYQPIGNLIDPGLTRREMEIMSYISFPDKIIAALLNISIRTVINHSVSIRRKTGCLSKGELIRYAANKQIIN